MLFFFFQAEDGIRDDLVTGVQTCALPIYKVAANDDQWHLNRGERPLSAGHQRSEYWLYLYKLARYYSPGAAANGSGSLAGWPLSLPHHDRRPAARLQRWRAGSGDRRLAGS